MTKDLSELSLSRKECPKCGAVWINGKHYFATGASYDGSELDLAGLVCNAYANETCINPCRGMAGGQTWEERAQQLDLIMQEIETDK
jgi:hypothetical protein